MLNLLKDENKWVKIAAFKSLGPFIASLESPNISEKLFEYYYSMTENATHTNLYQSIKPFNLEARINVNINIINLPKLQLFYFLLKCHHAPFQVLTLECICLYHLHLILQQF